MFIAIATGFFIVASTSLQFFDKSEKELRGLKIELKTMNQKIEGYLQTSKKNKPLVPDTSSAPWEWISKQGAKYATSLQKHLTVLCYKTHISCTIIAFIELWTSKLP